MSDNPQHIINALIGQRDRYANEAAQLSAQVSELTEQVTALKAAQVSAPVEPLPKAAKKKGK